MATANKTGVYDLNSTFSYSGHVYSQRCSDQLVIWAHMTPLAPIDEGPHSLSITYNGTVPASMVALGEYGANVPAATFNDSAGRSADVTSALLSFSHIASGGTPYVGSDKPFSISLWVNFDNIEAGEPHYLFAKDSGIGWEYLLYHGVDQKFVFSIRDQANTSSQQIRSAAAVSPSDYNQKWNHIVVTYDGRGGPSAYVGMSLFVNGVTVDMEDYSSSSSYDGMQPDSSGALYIGAWPTPDSELDGQLAEFAMWGVRLTDEEIKAIYNKTLRPGYISGPTNLPPRVQLNKKDNALGKYPTIARTGDKDFLGTFTDPFDDRLTLAFSGTNSTTTVQYPIMLNKDYPLFDTINSVSYLTSSLTGVRGLIPGVSDALIQINQNNIPSQSISPFDETRVYLDAASSFYQTGTDPNILPGFDARLADKTQIVINLDPLEDTKITWSTGTLPNASGYAAGVNSGIAYFNWNNRRWEAIGDLTSGSNVDYANERNMVRTGSMVAFGNQVMGIAFGSIPYDRTAETSGMPTNYAGFPQASKFDATGSQLLDMSKYLTHPFLLEKMVFEWSGTVGTYPIGSLLNATSTSNFFILNQFGTSLNNSITSGRMLQYLETEGTNTVLSVPNGPFPVSRHKELVAFGSIAVAGSSVDIDALPYWKKRDLILKEKSGQDGVTGSFRLEKAVTSPGIWTNAPYASRTRDPSPTSDYFWYGNPDGGRDLFGNASGRSMVAPIPGAVPSGSKFEAFASNPLNEPMLQPWTDLQRTSPYILMPKDRLVFGFVSQQQPGFSFDSTGEKAIADLYASNMAPGPSKVTLFGSLLKQSLPKESESNQPLTSNAIHEALHYDNPIVDQFDVEPVSSFSGSFIDSICAGRFFKTGLGYTIPPISDHVRGLRGSTAAGTQGITGSLLRGFKIVDDTERYYDSMMPSITDYIKQGGPDIETLSGRTMRRGRGPVIFPSGALRNFASRDLTIVASSASLPFPYANTPTRVTDESMTLVLSATEDRSLLLGMQHYDQIKSVLFKVGYKHKLVDVIDSTGARSTRWVKNERFVDSQGFRYGIASINKFNSSAVFRYDHYGQFRDMLEQRRDTRFFVKDPNNRGVSSVEDGPVKVMFVDSSNNIIDADQTTSQNLSKFFTSSLPYFDGHAVDRTGNPSRIEAIRIE